MYVPFHYSTELLPHKKGLVSIFLMITLNLEILIAEIKVLSTSIAKDQIDIDFSFYEKVMPDTQKIQTVILKILTIQISIYLIYWNIIELK